MIDTGGRTGALLAVAVALAVLTPGCLLVLRRRDALGLLLAVIGSAIVTSGAGLLAVITRTPTRPWFVTAVLALYLVGLLRRGRPARRADSSQWLVATVSVVVAGAVATPFLSRAPVQWDARSIWFFHASWFAAPSTAYTDLATAERFSHPDYPPLAPSAGGFAWFFGDSRNDWIPQMATGILTVAAIAVLALLVSQGLTTRRSQLLTASAVSLVAAAILRGNGFDGYVDGTAAVLLAVVVMAAVLGDSDSTPVVIGALALALVKNEAFLFLIVVVVPLYVLARRPIGPLIPGVAAGLAWAVAIRLPGLDLLTWHPGNALPGSDDFGGRLKVILDALASDDSLRSAALLWVGALATVLARSSRAAKLIIGITGAVGATLLAVIVGIYLASPSNLEWHLSTSANRLAMHPALVLAVGAIAAVTHTIHSQTQPRNRVANRT